MAQKTKKRIAGVGTGVAVGAAAALAGYYFYADKNAKKHRKMAAAWANNLKKDAVKEIKKLEKIDKASITRAVNKASALYKKAATGATGKEVARATAELKKNWHRLQKEVGTRVARVRKAATSKKRA